MLTNLFTSICQTRGAVLYLLFCQKPGSYVGVLQENFDQGQLRSHAIYEGVEKSHQTPQP